MKLGILVPALVMGAAGWAAAATYEVGPGKPYPSIGDVPWESLDAGDTVLIHYRAAPYTEKFVLCRQGTAADRIVVRGVPDGEGQLPVIDGRDATTRSQLNYWNERRGVIKIGGANTPPDTMPRHITVENLDIRSGREPYWFTGRDGYTNYTRNAASIYIEKGENIIIRNCVLHDSGNGLFCGSGTSNLLVEACYIWDNGAETSIYEHNNYTEAFGITFQFNRFGPLRTDCPGNNLKDRSGRCVIRYNWIESGNRQLDLVDSDYAHIYDAPEYRATFVYGNILIEPDGAGNSQIIHYGGDSGTLAHYRQGTLHFFNNTVVSTRSGNTTLVRLSTSNETADIRNNILYVTASGDRLAITDDSGTADLRSNWMKPGWRNSHSLPAGTVNDLGGNITGSTPGFVDESSQDFTLLETSACTGAATSVASIALPANNVTNEYAKHQGARPRYDDGNLDIGACEFNPDTDYDSMPDSWELLYFSSITNMSAVTDSDRDGFHDWKEYVAGTIPTNSASLLIILSARRGAAEDQIELRWQAVAEKSYALLTSTNLFTGAWSTNLAHLPGIEPDCTHTITAVHRLGFVRVVVE